MPKLQFIATIATVVIAHVAISSEVWVEDIPNANGGNYDYQSVHLGRFSLDKGAFLGAVSTPNQEGLAGIVSSPTGDRVVYLDFALGYGIPRTINGLSGFLVDTNYPNAIVEPGAGAFGPDGNLYIPAPSYPFPPFAPTGTVYRINLVTRTQDTFLTYPSSFLETPQALAFDQTDSLVVVDTVRGIMRYSFPDGSVISPVASISTGSLENPVAVTADSVGRIYVADAARKVVRRYTDPSHINSWSGGDFIPAGTGGLSAPSQVTIGPDQKLYVLSAPDKILRFDPDTGAFLDVFATAGSDRAFGAFAFTAGPPAVSISSSSTGLKISWPQIAQGFELLRSDSVSGGTWIVVPDSPSLNDGKFEIQIPQPIDTEFFRLHWPE